MSMLDDDRPSGYTTNDMPVAALGHLSPITPYPPPPIRRGIGFAISSMLLGAGAAALALIPFPYHFLAALVPGLLAIIFGHLGFGQARAADSNAGRALAAIGLVLGYLSVGYAAVSFAVEMFHHAVRNVRLRHHATPLQP